MPRRPISPPDMKRSPLAPLLGVAALLLLTACQSIDSRIRQHAQTFDQLPATEQERIRTGQIMRGDTLELVFIALGEPHQKNEITVSNGSKRQTWRYLERRYIKDGVKLTPIVGSIGGSARNVQENYRVVNVVGTEVVFMDDIVVAVRGGPPPPVAAPTPKDSQVSLGDE